MSRYNPGKKGESTLEDTVQAALRQIEERSCGRPMGYLFPKQSGKDEPIDSFFLSRHIHAHERRLGWPERITCHSFRHAFGTHLYENIPQPFMSTWPAVLSKAL